MPARNPLPPTYLSATEEEEGAAQLVGEVQTRVADQRARFFEQIALLSGGAIVISVSLLSTLFGKVVLHLVAVLILGWGELLLTLLASFYRAGQYQSYMMEFSMRQYMQALARKKIALYQQVKNGHVVLGEPDEEGLPRPVPAHTLQQQAAAAFDDARLRQKWSDKHFMHVRYAENLAVVSFWLGVLSLAVFASVNIFKATLESQRPALQYISRTRSLPGTKRAGKARLDPLSAFAVLLDRRLEATDKGMLDR